MVVQVIPIPTEVVSHSNFSPILIPNSVFYSHSHGIPGPIGNPIPMHISTVYIKCIHVTLVMFLHYLTLHKNQNMALTS